MQHTAWPWTDLISLVYRYASKNLSGLCVLELGCGTGANASFFLASGVDYHAIEGSAAAVSVVHQRFPELRNSVIVGDFTSSFPSSPPFDLVVDRAALTHNSTDAIQHTLTLTWNSLKVGGLYIGIDWFSEGHSDRKYGTPVADENTFTEFSDGQFKGCGKVHFSDESHLRSLFSRFEILSLAEKTVRRLEPKDDHLFASYNIVARKPHD